MIENTHLQALVAIIETGSLSRAAEYLKVTQSAISQSVKVLETKVGFKIVVRQGKSMAITPEAQKLGRLAKTYFRRFDDFLEEIQNEKNKISGTIHVGTLIGLGKSWVASRMTEFSGQYPELSVRVTLDFPDKILKAFHDHHIDC